MKQQLESIIAELRKIDASGIVLAYIHQAIEDLEDAVAECDE